MNQNVLIRNSTLNIQHSTLRTAHNSTSALPLAIASGKADYKTQKSKLKILKYMRDFKDIKVAVAGTGYVGLSIATLLSQHHHVTSAAK